MSKFFDILKPGQHQEAKEKFKVDVDEDNRVWDVRGGLGGMFFAPKRRTSVATGVAQRNPS